MVWDSSANRFSSGENCVYYRLKTSISLKIIERSLTSTYPQCGEIDLTSPLSDMRKIFDRMGEVKYKITQGEIYAT